MSEIPPDLHAEVVLRAENRCEYCQLSQEGQEATFHIDHVVPRSVGGLTTSDNLALACVSCSLRKWAKQTAIDPETGQMVLLFHPRLQVWSEHFKWEREVVLPLTPTGRATVAALAMNRSQIVAIRQEESVRGRHPPHTSPSVNGPKRH
jgi:HNH endonuclease